MTDRLAPSLIEIKRASLTEEGVFTGYASTFGGEPDFMGDIIRPGAYGNAIRKHAEAGTTPGMLWHHDSKEPVGKWLSLEEDHKGLLVTGKLTLGTKRGKEAHELIKDRALSMSVSIIVARGGSTKKSGIRYITEVERLHEISLVTIPANSHAKITEFKNKPETVREFQKAMQGMGFNLREAKFLTTRGYRDLTAPGERSEDNLLCVLEKLHEELKEQREWRAILQRLLEERNYVDQN